MATVVVVVNFENGLDHCQLVKSDFGFGFSQLQSKPFPVKADQRLRSTGQTRCGSHSAQRVRVRQLSRSDVRFG
ncbi:hypothetical protein Hanom_Chr09g00770491 [Helianthus anomalus]